MCMYDNESLSMIFALTKCYNHPLFLGPTDVSGYSTIAFQLTDRE